MKRQLHVFLTLFFIGLGMSHSYGQYCTGGPTNSADSEITDVILQGDCASISNLNTCPGQTGVVDYTATDSASLHIGGSYDLIVTFGTCGGNYSGYGEAWIDWNQNGVFDSTAESLGTWSGTPTQVDTFSFVVPATASLGSTRLRVMQREGFTSLPLDPCASFTWGAVEDYGINITSAAPTCVTPTGFSLDSINGTGAYISWASAGTSFIVEYDTAGFAPGFGNFDTVATNSAVLTGLMAQTNYDVYIYNDCGAGGLSCGLKGTFFSPCAPISVFPYVENFNGINWNGGFHPCWSSSNASTGFTPYEWFVNSGATGSSGTGPSDDVSGSGNYLYTEASGPNQGDSAFAVSPEFDLTSLTTPYVSFYYHMYGVNMGSLVLQGNSGSGWSNITTLNGQQQSASTDPWIYTEINVSAFKTSSTRFRFVGIRGAGFESDISIDDFAVNEAPPCPRPNGLALISKTSNSATFYWNQNASWSQVEWGISPYTQGTGTKVSVNNDTITITGLTSNTTYDVFVRDSCNATDKSAWIGPLTFWTPCLPQSMPYTEDFTNWTPNCFSFSGSPFAHYTTAGPPAREMMRGSTGFNVWGFANTPAVSINALAWFKFKYSHQYSAFGADTLMVLARAVGSSSWDTLKVLEGSTFDTPGATFSTPAATLKDEIIYLPGSYVGSDIEFQIAYRYSGGSYVFVEDLEVAALPPCQDPSSFNLDSVQGYDAVVSWFTTGTVNQYFVEWGLQGYSQGTGAWFGRDTVTSMSAAITGLSPTTCYDVYVQTDCGASGQSAWVGPFNFCTTVSCPAPSALTLSNVGTNNAEIGFTSGGSNQWNYVVGPKGTTPSTGTITYGVTSNPIQLSGLNSGTAYSFWLRDSCGPGDVSTWVGPFDFSTLCLPSSLNYTETFDPINWITSDELLCWDTQGGTQPWRQYTGTNNAAVAEFWSYNVGNNMVMTTPLIDLSQKSRLRFKWSHQYNATYPNDSLIISIKDSSTSTWTTIWAEGQSTLESNDGAGPTAPGTFVEDTVIIDSNLVGGYIQVRFEGVSGWGPNLYIGDVVVEVDPNFASCPAPQALLDSNITATSADVYWTGGSGSSWEISYGLQGITPQTGTKMITTSANTTLTSLMSASNYAYFVREICGAGDTSVWAGPRTFTTACATFSSPFLETFDNSGEPNCWMNISGTNGSTVWETTDGTFPWPAYGAQGIVDHTGNSGYAMGVDGSGSSDSVMLETPPIDVSSLSSPELRFWIFSNNTNNPGDNNELHVDVFDGNNWNASVMVYAADSSAWVENVVSLVPYAASGEVIIRFRYMATASTTFYNDILIDDVEVNSGSACGTPSNVMVSKLTCDSIEFSYTQVQGVLYNWVEYGPKGFTPGQGTLLTNPGATVMIGGLMPATAYEFLILDSCAAGLSSVTVLDTLSASGPLPSAGFTAVQTTTTLTNATWTFDASGTLYADSISWFFKNDGTTQYGSNVNKVYTSNGIDSVTVTFTNSCGSEDTTFAVIVQYIGIEESELAKTLKVYPNPSSGFVNISFNVENEMDFQIQVIDNYGKVILSNNYRSEGLQFSKQLDLSRLAAGVYSIELITTKGSIHKQVSIQPR